MHSRSGKTHFKICSYICFCNLFLLVLLNCSDAATSNATSLLGNAASVKFLPGFDGPLPFELETGYIGVGESEDVQLFYYFLKSERNPAKDPLFLWLSGGPGCSSFFGLIYEIGPIQFEQVQYFQNGVPKLMLNPYSWTQIASLIFLDLPVGVGFSYAKNTKAAQSDVLLSCEQAYEFLKKWLVDHPQFISNEVYIGGESYSGFTIPIIAEVISNGNDIGLKPRINLKGYVLGNPGTTLDIEDYHIPYAHGMGLISNELFKSLEETCRGKYHDINPKNSLCVQNMKTFNELLQDINEEHILEPNCPFVSRSRNLLGRTGTIYQKDNSDSVKLELLGKGSPFKCRSEGYKLSYQWANDINVQEAIHIRKGTIGEWLRCNRHLPFDGTVNSSVPYHARLSIKGFRSLIFSGDHDLIIPYIGTEAWIKSLNYSIVDDWRPWRVDDQVAGYTRTYANQITFATIKGSGHVGPEYKPAECSRMIERWVSHQPL